MDLVLWRETRFSRLDDNADLGVLALSRPEFSKARHEGRLIPGIELRRRDNARYTWVSAWIPAGRHEAMGKAYAEGGQPAYDRALEAWKGEM